MANSMSITSSPIPTTKDTLLKERNSLTRSLSAKSLGDGAKKMERSYSDHYLCYSVNRIRASATQPKLKNSRSFDIFKIQLSYSIIPNSLRSFLSYPETSSEDIEEGDTEMEGMTGNSLEGREYEISSVGEDEMEKPTNCWIERLMEIRSHWRERQEKDRVDGDGDGAVQNQECGEDGDDEGGCEVEYDNEEGESGEISIDRESFSKLLARVSWSDERTFARLASLCNMAYVIPEIKAKDLKKNYGLDFITSSLEKKAKAAALREKSKLDDDSTSIPISSPCPNEEYPLKALNSEEKALNRNAAYEIAASAASYVHCCAKDLLTLHAATKQEDRKIDLYGNSESQHEEEDKEEECSSPRMYKSEVAAHVAASTMTMVVAAGEKEKQKAAKDLQSLHSSPCEWFVVDDPSTYTRCFIIQGSDSLASWQANLFFEPTKFEGTEVLVHRGIYEAAKGIYEQFMPQIVEHLSKHGERAKLQFTGHSLGGSLSLLVNLMLLTRNIVKPSALRPVVTFGSPFVFCDGQKILNKLGVNEDSVHCVMMHRDIVPRAFACNYPNYIAQFLKRLSGTFRSHPCLNKKKLLYSPMGKMFILQPDQSLSPPHPFLPPGSALYVLESTQNAPPRFEKNAVRAFFNSPHPLETLKDPMAYSSEGTIRRDHDSSNYVKAVNAVIRQQHVNIMVQKASKERNALWPLLTSQSPHAWGREYDLEEKRLVSKEIMTSA